MSCHRETGSSVAAGIDVDENMAEVYLGRVIQRRQASGILPCDI